MKEPAIEATEEIEKVGDILKSGGAAFQTQPALLAAITKKKCIDTHAALKTRGGGWIGVPLGDSRLTQQEAERESKIDEYAAMSLRVIECIVNSPEFKQEPDHEMVEIYKQKRLKRYPVRVRRISGDEANRDHVIKVTVNGPKERNIFKPGEDVNLTESQLNGLNDAVVNSEIEIEPTSGIMSAKDPMVAAKNMYPGFQVRRDPQTGFIVLYRTEPKYSIEYLGEVPTR